MPWISAAGQKWLGDSTWDTCRVHSGIRVHLTLRGRNSLYIHPIGTKCTSNAFFFHAEDGKNIFISLLHSGGGKLAPPPPLRRLTDSGIRVSGGFLCCGALLRSGVRLEHLEGEDLSEGLWRGHDFLQEMNDGERSERVLSWNNFQTAYKIRTVTVLVHT